MAIKSILICWIVKVKDWSMRALNTKSDDEFQCKIKLHFKTISDIVTKLNKRMNNYMYGKSFKNQLISAASFQHCFSLTISLDCSLVRAWPFSGIERVSHSHYFHFSCGGGGAWWCVVVLFSIKFIVSSFKYWNSISRFVRFARVT